MITIEKTDAPARLHEMWRAVFTNGVVQITNQGRPVAEMVWKGTAEDRAALIDELRETIGFELIPQF